MICWGIVVKFRGLYNTDNHFSVKTYWHTFILTDKHRVKTPDGVFESQALNPYENNKSEPGHSAPNLRFWAHLAAFACHHQWVFGVQTHKIWVCAAHGWALPGVGTAQSRSPWSVLSFLFVFASCVQRDCISGQTGLCRAVCHPSLLNNSQCSLLSETFEVQAALRAMRGFVLILTTARAKADFGVKLWSLKSAARS